MPQHTRAAGSLRRRVVGALLLSLGCADDGSPQSMALPPPYREPLPLPGCEGFEYGPCDVRLPACVENLASIASCVRGDVTPAPSPSVMLLSQQEAEQSLLAALAANPPPSPNYYERALVLLGLSQPSAFEPATTAARLAQTYAAYYRRDTGELVVIDHGDALATAGRGSAATQALVLHELIHALQDREHDLDAFALAHQQDSEGNLRGNCVIEGEAQLHMLRLYSALWGEDVAQLDWPSELRSRRNVAEDELFLQQDLYSASLLSVPYTFGVEYVQHIWAEQGAAGVKGLFAQPPASMREILATLWPNRASAPGLRVVPPLAPDGLTREAYSSLGAWGVYLLVRPRTTLDQARQLALGWSGDLLEAFSFGDEQTAVSWTVELATESDAALLADALRPEPRLRSLQSGAQLQILAASSALPAVLVAANPPPELAER